ncbi:MAG: flavin reductase family protein [Rugosibacter sp.]|jgi:flavin reductase (DIM6/NTAB) family NADH-FMN oxidoreductase RutF|nr:flavin reductase family protein [Rugosibacter sp.]
MDTKQFRHALGSFATGVTIITTRDEAGGAIGVTANSFNSLSLDPPLVLWSIGVKAFSYPAFAKAKHFAVHVLAADQQALSDRFARPSTEKFDGVLFEHGLGEVPLFPGCAAVFECSTERCVEGGDHVIMIGRVERFSVNESALPLMFYRGRYAIPEAGGIFSPPAKV